ncbi:hypothetical protein OIN81_16860, partial [Acinetobacter baumannii]|nr:hypothetical protein [Acinetobacter baumannii]
MTQHANNGNNLTDLNFLIANVELVDEDIKQWVLDNPNKEKAVLEDTSVNNAQYKQITHKDWSLRQKLVHENQNQKIRLQHLNLSLINISDPTSLCIISFAFFSL